MKKTISLLLVTTLFIFISCDKDDSNKKIISNAEALNPVCKFDDPYRSFQTPTNESKIEYELVGTTLRLKHINTAFNCCINRIEALISIDADVITVTESEDLDGGGCNCNCLYDFEFEISNIDQPIYKIKIIEPYLNSKDPKLEFTINFEAGKTGEFKVSRNSYPYGL